MEIAHPSLHQMCHVCFYQDVDREALAWPFDHGQFELSGDLATGAICTQEILAAYMVGLAADSVEELRPNGTRVFGLLKRHKGRVEASLKTISGGISYQDGLQKCLWKIERI